MVMGAVMRIVLFALIIFQCVSNINGCSDIRSYKKICATYKSRGYCSDPRYKSWMNINCKETCGFCTKSKKCIDSSTYSSKCHKWKSQNLCKQRGAWYIFMSNNCRKTCQLCKDIKPTIMKKTSPLATTTTTTTTRSRWVSTTQNTSTSKSCQNSPSQNCESWIHFCRRPTILKPNKWYTFMNTHCKKTCHWCDKTGLECGVNRKESLGSIIAGTNALPSTWIWQAAIYYYNDFVCGGSLITSQHILTAAHCVRYKEAEGFKIVLGDYNRHTKDKQEIEVEIESIKYHQEYSSKTLDNDIAILKLKTLITLLKNDIGIVCLPEVNEQITVGTKCYITGWGRMEDGGTSVNILQEAKIPIVSNLECGKRNINKQGESRITQNMICAGYESGSKVSGCQGDSGGPLVCKSKENKWVLQGVVSWGSRDCDADKRYTVFTRTNRFIDWIKNKL